MINENELKILGKQTVLIANELLERLADEDPVIRLNVSLNVFVKTVINENINPLMAIEHICSAFMNEHQHRLTNSKIN